MKLVRSPLGTALGACGILAGACLSLTAMAQGSFGLAGDSIQANLTITTAPEAGNYFTQDANGYATSTQPIHAVVGSGIEFGYYPQQISSYTWRITVDVSDNRIAINETLSDPNPGYWLGEYTAWTLSISDLDWAGAAGIADVGYVSQDSQIGIKSFDARSIQFAIGDIVVYPQGAYSISRTTVVELTAIPEPSAAVLLLCGSAAVLWRKGRPAFRNCTTQTAFREAGCGLERQASPQYNNQSSP